MKFVVFYNKIKEEIEHLKQTLKSKNIFISDITRDNLLLHEEIKTLQEENRRILNRDYSLEKMTRFIRTFFTIKTENGEEIASGDGFVCKDHLDPLMDVYMKIRGFLTHKDLYFNQYIYFSGVIYQDRFKIPDIFLSLDDIEALNDFFKRTSERACLYFGRALLTGQIIDIEGMSWDDQRKFFNKINEIRKDIREKTNGGKF